MIGYEPVDTWTRISKLEHCFAKFKTCLAPNTLVPNATSYLQESKQT